MTRRSWYADDPRLHAVIASVAPAVRELAEHVAALAPVVHSALAEVHARAGRPRGRAAQRSPYDIGGRR